MSYPTNWTRDEDIGRAAPDIIERRSSLSSAVRALDDHELRLLLIALLQEWRGRTALRDGDGT